MLPECGFGSCGSLLASERCYRDQTTQQHVHVPSQSGHEAYFPGLQVGGQCKGNLKKGKVQRESLPFILLAHFAGGAPHEDLRNEVAGQEPR